jgi:hypothetical protein
MSVHMRSQATNAGVRTARFMGVAAVPLAVGPVAPHLQRSGWDRPLVLLAVLMIAVVLCYALGMLIASRRNPRSLGARPAGDAAGALPASAASPASRAVPSPAGALSASAGAMATAGTAASAAASTALSPASTALSPASTALSPASTALSPASTAVSPASAAERPHPGAGAELFFVFVLPCLNEEKVVLASLRRLPSMPGDNFGVVVVDDGSDDDTAAIVSSVADARVSLLRRTAPDARQGKGEALNAAIGHLTGGGLLTGRDHDHVIVVVMDADGRLESRAIAEVSPYFADSAVGAVQIGVRINNREQSRLARMQDMEFVIHTEVFQRGRRHLGSVGLGGNGQFMRLSALLSLGPSPWTRSLTEDLDVGVRLLTAGWRNEYCPTLPFTSRVLWSCDG